MLALILSQNRPEMQGIKLLSGVHKEVESEHYSSIVAILLVSAVLDLFKEILHL